MIKIYHYYFILFLLLGSVKQGFTQGSGNALYFDGDNYIVIPTTGVEPNQGTIEMWVKSTWTYPGGPFASYYMWFDLESPRLNLYFKNGDLRTHWWAQGDNIICDVNWDASKWYHYAATYDFTNDSYNFYRNGQLIGTSNASRATASLSSTAKIGCRYSSTYNWHGQIDEVRIWSDVRTQSEIQEWMNKNVGITNEPNLEYFYKLDESDVGVNSVIDSMNGYSGNPYNMNVTDVRVSTAPIGTRSHVGTGTSNLSENVEVAVDLSWNGGGDAGASAIFAAIQVDSRPILTTGLPAYFADSYWEIWVHDDDGAYNMDAIFHFDELGGITDESTLTLYYRSNASSSWSEYPNISIDDEGDNSDGIGTITALGLTSSSQFILSSSDADNHTLPISLVNYELICQNGLPNLKWTTLTEMNNSQFEVSKSMDGKNFEVIEVIKGQINSNQSIEYNYQCNENEKALYYKLSQEDLNGVKKDLGIVFNNCVETFDFDIVYEGDGNLTMEFRNINRGINTIQVVDMKGNILYQSTNLGIDKEIKINLGNNIEKGLYHVSVKDENITKTKSFLTNR